LGGGGRGGRRESPAGGRFFQKKTNRPGAWGGRESLLRRDASRRTSHRRERRSAQLCHSAFLFFFPNELWVFIFFFQAEDGIRASSVTGVQTCALPILAWDWGRHVGKLKANAGAAKHYLFNG